MVGMFVCLCLASKKPSEREFFVPAGMDLAVKLLSKLLVILMARTMCWLQCDVHYAKFLWWGRYGTICM